MDLVLVDDNDAVIGHKNKNALTSSDIYRVARLLIINSRGQLLLAQRAFNKKKDPGLWGLAVEGTVEAGETYESNIRKEAEEEIGATLGDIKLGPKLRMTGKYNHHCQFFIYHADLDVSKLILQQEELEMVKWFHREALEQEVASHPANFGYNFNLILAKALPYIR